MNELSQRLRDNYINEIKEYLEFLKSKGFVLMVDYGTTNLRVNQYNASKNKFVPRFEMFEFPNLILQEVPNYYKLDVTTDISNLTREILPELSHEELRDYLTYLKYSESVGDGKQLKNEWKELKKISKEMGKDIDKSMFDVAYTQAQALAKENIIYVDSRNMSKGYYMFDKGSGLFKKCNDKQIVEILKDCFKYDGFNNFTILNNMKRVYMNHIVNSDLPVKWNNHVKAINVLESNKKNYERIKKVTDNFI